MITIVDLACGAGLASLGVKRELKRQGIEAQVLLGVDPWGYALASFERNHPEAETVPYTIEEALARGLIPLCDLLLTGPPCQGDSRMGLARGTARRDDLAATKYAALEAGQALSRFMVMEAVGSYWHDWMRHHVAVTRVLQDCALGGYTMRKRLFGLWGFTFLPPILGKAGPGWGAALPAWCWRDSDRELLLTSEAARKTKRLRRAKHSRSPAHAVVGQGGAHQVIEEDGSFVHRLTPEEGLALQGFPAVKLSGDKRRRQTQAGNGWPATFGGWIARAIVLNHEL